MCLKIELREIGDATRFSVPAKLVAYAGLDASVKQSGNFEGSQMHMSKRGSPYLRRAIFMAASVACHHDLALSAYYQKLKARGKHHFVTITSPIQNCLFSSDRASSVMF